MARTLLRSVNHSSLWETKKTPPGTTTNESIRNGATSTRLVPKCNVLSCAQTTAGRRDVALSDRHASTAASGAGDFVTVRVGLGAISSSSPSSHPLVSVTSSATRTDATRRVTS